jgi:hypothetical protein
VGYRRGAPKTFLEVAETDFDLGILQLLFDRVDLRLQGELDFAWKVHAECGRVNPRISLAGRARGARG